MIYDKCVLEIIIACLVYIYVQPYVPSHTIMICAYDMHKFVLRTFYV